MKIALLLISTNKYHVFLDGIIESARKHFFPGHEVEIHLFTDKRRLIKDNGLITYQYLIPPYKFPEATLYRYKIFNEHTEYLKNCDYLFYCDVDMLFVDTVSTEILLENGLTSVFHPGFYSNLYKVGHWGSNGVVRESLAWIEPEKRNGYCAGGFQGGATKEYLKACNMLAARIEDDENRGVMAEYHDESHWNWLLKSGLFQNKTINPEYCMVEEIHLRKQWGINHLNPKLIALKKNHKEIRS